MKLVERLFRLINYQHLKEKTLNGKPYIKKIIEINGFRTALIEMYDGQRKKCLFMFKIGNKYI